MESSSSSSSSASEAVSVGIGAKGTIVSLMEKELRLEEEQIHHLPMRNEVVSSAAYCGSLFVSSSMKSSKRSASAGRDNLARPGSYRESKSSSWPFLQRSSSLKSVTRSKEDHQFQQRKKVVSYHPAAYSGMLAFMESEEGTEQKQQQPRPSKSAALWDDAAPILSHHHHHQPVLGRKAKSPSSSSVMLSKLSSPVKIVDTRCNIGGRESFQLRGGEKAQKKLSFWRL